MEMTEKFKREFLLYSNVTTDIPWNDLRDLSFIEKLDTVRRWCFIKVNLSDADLVEI